MELSFLTSNTFPWAPQRVAKTANPSLALQNWMTRDVHFARRVGISAEHHGYPQEWVDGQKTVAETTEMIASHFRLKAKRN